MGEVALSVHRLLAYDLYALAAFRGFEIASSDFFNGLFDHNGWAIIDVSDAREPFRVAGEPTGIVWGVAQQGAYMYLADTQSGLHVVDVSTPTAPFWVGSCPTSGFAKDVEVVGSYAYVAADSGGLDIIDVSAPAHPVRAANCDPLPHMWAEKVDVLGAYAYVAYVGAVAVIDVSNPHAPRHVLTYDPGTWAMSVVIAGGHLYVAGDEGVLAIAAVHIRGDLNCAGRVDFGDINPFVLALANPAGYKVQYPRCHLRNAEINRDGLVDFGDLNPFVRLLTRHQGDSVATTACANVIQLLIPG